jgi:hypothetical protein
VHALGERRLRGEERRDQVIGKHTPSLRVCFEPNEAGFPARAAKSLVRRQPVGPRLDDAVELGDQRRALAQDVLKVRR